MILRGSVLRQVPLHSRLGVYKWSPEGLYDKSASWIPNSDEILKLLKKKKRN